MRASRLPNQDLFCRLQAWEASGKALAEQMRMLVGVLGGDLEAPLPSTVWAMYAEYTALLGKAVGDEDHWLEWYWQDNAWGAKGLVVRTPTGVPLAVQSVESLVEVLLW